MIIFRPCPLQYGLQTELKNPVVVHLIAFSENSLFNENNFYKSSLLDVIKFSVVTQFFVHV